MNIKFYKYQGTGNDFIMIDGRSQTVNLSVKEISKLCNRKFGIGADGIIILKNIEDADFEMDYSNADGSKSFCGNGSRCAMAFASYLNIIKESCAFKAIDGYHKGKLQQNSYATKMGNVKDVQLDGKNYIIHTGSPHYVKYVENVEDVDVFKEGRIIRNLSKFKEKGINVNFVSKYNGLLKVRTYERGVEDETLSCGTGVTAVAISAMTQEPNGEKNIQLQTKGGMLNVELMKVNNSHFEEIWLKGPAKFVFMGNFNGSDLKD